MALKNSTSTSAELNLIGHGTQIDGNLKTEHSIRIDGLLKGTVICKNTVTVGENGRVEGDIEALNAIIEGRIKGRVLVKEKLVLGPKSALSGELKAKTLIIDEGAVFDGTSTMANSSASSVAEQGKVAAGSKESA